MLIRWFGVVLIPGLLQTPDYARAMLYGNEADVESRLARQAILTRQPRPAAMFCVLDESALRRDIGGPAVMYEQLQHLVKLCEADNISIRIVPAKRARGLKTSPRLRCRGRP